MRGHLSFLLSTLFLTKMRLKYITNMQDCFQSRYQLLLYQIKKFKSKATWKLWVKSNLEEGEFLYKFNIRIKLTERLDICIDANSRGTLCWSTCYSLEQNSASGSIVQWFSLIFLSVENVKYVQMFASNINTFFMQFSDDEIFHTDYTCTHLTLKKVSDKVMITLKRIAN